MRVQLDCTYTVLARVQCLLYPGTCMTTGFCTWRGKVNCKQSLTVTPYRADSNNDQVSYCTGHSGTYSRSESVRACLFISRSDLFGGPLPTWHTPQYGDGVGRDGFGGQRGEGSYKPWVCPNSPRQNRQTRFAPTEGVHLLTRDEQTAPDPTTLAPAKLSRSSQDDGDTSSSEEKL